MYPIYVLLVALLVGSASALRLPFKARVGRAGRRTGLGRRSKFSATIGNISELDYQNTEYIGEITVGGSKFEVVLDTGSSDLNILGNVSAFIDTTIPINVTYAEGSSAGVLAFADVEFAGYTVPLQVFNHGPASEASPPDQGVLGLGPSSGSIVSYTAQTVLPTIGRNATDNLLDRIFLQNTSTPNYITFQLGRQENPNTNSTALLGVGELTIGEVVPGYGKIWKMPKLEVLPFSVPLLQHFTVVLDGVIGADGKNVSFPTSVVSGVPSGKLVAVFDSGYTIAQVPKAIADAFYSGIPGTSFQNITGVGEIYILPCDAALNASFVFGGYDYPIHPLDLNEDSGMTYSNGTEMCGGLFQPIQADATESLDGAADMILGMPFLRNVYVMMNHGDFVDKKADVRKTPYVRLLSTTDAAKATAEFISVRGGNGRA